MPARGADPRSRHRRARSAHLPDHLLRVRFGRARGEPVQSANLRQRLHAPVESDHGGVRRAHGGARGRARGAGARHRAGGGNDGPAHAVRAGRRDRIGVDAVRRNLRPVRSEFPQARDQHDLRQSRRAREFPPRDHQQDQGGVRRDHGQPADQRARHRSGGQHRARGRRAADRRQYVRVSVSMPPVRVRRRHRGALGDQIHRRARHHHGRGDRRVGKISLGQWQLPRHDRALARLSRRALLRDLRRFRLHHESAHGDAQDLRPGAVAVQRVDAAAGPGDPAPAHEDALRQRAQGGAVSAIACAGELGELSRPRFQPLPRARPEIPATGLRRHHDLRRQGRRQGGRSLHRCGAVHEPPRQRRRRAHAGDPPGLDHPPPVVGGGANHGRRFARHGPHLGRAGGNR